MGNVRARRFAEEARSVFSLRIKGYRACRFSEIKPSVESGLVASSKEVRKKIKPRRMGDFCAALCGIAVEIPLF